VLTIPAAVGVLTNDTDPEGDPLSASLDNANGPAHGTVALAADGSFVYTPAAGFSGTDSFGYIVSDGHGGAAEATVVIKVLQVSQPPVAVPESYAVTQGTVLTVPAVAGVLAADYAPDGEPLSAGLLNGPAHGTLTLKPDGSFVYQPNATFSGTDSFSYKVSDSQGGFDVGGVFLSVAPASTASTVVAAASTEAPVQPLTGTALAPVPTAGTSAGAATVSEGAPMAGSSPVAQGQAVFSMPAPAGGPSFTSFYGGDTDGSGSDALGSAPTVTTLSSAGSPAGAAPGIAFTATVTSATGGPISGTVTFKDGATTLATVALTNGKATFSTSWLWPGTHNITAVYSGNSQFASSTSPTLAADVVPFVCLYIWPFGLLLILGHLWFLIWW